MKDIKKQTASKEELEKRNEELRQLRSSVLQGVVRPVITEVIRGEHASSRENVKEKPAKTVRNKGI